MFMTTTLAHYQLPVFGTGSTALQTEIGADQRSLLLRPITSGAERTELPPGFTVQASEKLTTPMEFKQWMKVLFDYEASANGRNASASEPASDPEQQV
ncbi:MAG: hypothetical protein ACK41U_06535 [Paracoccus sp. (in: a-proteobacteria)]|uniref:hypothetical protein n=1 Tax=Paracoccus sp. TaxID=267 RepID=UPI00391A4472